MYTQITINLYSMPSDNGRQLTEEDSIMTPEQWLSKHYPIPASALSEATDEECLLHCENKWEGAKEENLPDGAKYEWHVMFDDNYYDEMVFDANTCALCAKYNKLCSNTDGQSCPIIRMQGVTCDSCNNNMNIYLKSENDPAPMIDLLKRTLEFVKAGG